MGVIPTNIAKNLDSVDELCRRLKVSHHEITNSTQAFREQYMSPISGKRGIEIMDWSVDGGNIELKRMAQGFIGLYRDKHWPKDYRWPEGDQDDMAYHDYIQGYTFST